MARKKEEEKVDKVGIFSDTISILSKLFKSKTLKFLDFTTKAFDFITKRIEKELKRLKRVLMQLSLAAMAIIFLLIGGTMYLEKIFPALSHGLNFIAVGVFFLIILWIYSIVNRD